MKSFQGLGRVLAYVFNWAFNPVTNSRRDALSLGRLLFLGFTVAVIWAIYSHLSELRQMTMPCAVFLSVAFIILSSYCYIDKPHMRELFLALAGKIGGGINLANPVTTENAPLTSSVTGESANGDTTTVTTIDQVTVSDDPVTEPAQKPDM